MGKLIGMEGVDASGKETQVNLLYRKLKTLGHKVIKIEYPRYEEKSSALVRMYLRDKAFGDNPNEISPYVVSSFYAVDRAADYYRTDGKGWKRFYDEGYIILADRYVSSNCLFQATKEQDKEKRDNLLDWINIYEHDILDLPRPDKTFFLDLPPSYGQKAMQRANKKLDLHESNSEILNNAYERATELVEKYDWDRIECLNEAEERRTIEEINEEMLKKVLDIIE